MKECPYCMNKVTFPNAHYCQNCGKQLPINGYHSEMLTVAKNIMVAKCFIFGWLLIPLIWLLPITLRIKKREKSDIKLGTNFKVRTLFFGNFLAGICLLIDEDA